MKAINNMSIKITKEQIDKAKKGTNYSTKQQLHQHDDCIRMAYEWLDAQKKIKGKCSSTFALKHIIEKWAGRYISMSDVEVAANMHKDIQGDYPWYNISSRLTEPSSSRLENIREAYKHNNYREMHVPYGEKSSHYKIKEH